MCLIACILFFYIHVNRPSGGLDTALFVWGYWKLIHLSRATPPSLVSEALQLFDVEVKQYFMKSIAAEATDCA